MLSKMKSLPLIHTPKVSATIAHLLLFLATFIIFYARKYEQLRWDFLNDLLPDFHLHISNFSIAYILFSGVGFLWILMGVPMRLVLLLGLVISIINLAFELWIPVLNTPDMRDAVYGLAGVSFAAIELFLIRQFGLREKKG